MKTYAVKTRNWHCKKWVKFLLDFSEFFGASRCDNYEDGDGKYWIETSSAVKAWGLWLYFMALRKFSGGWTYIVRPGKELIGGTYSAIY
jgi:hypothetical protein